MCLRVGQGEDTERSWDGVVIAMVSMMLELRRLTPPTGSAGDSVVFKQNTAVSQSTGVPLGGTEFV